jgi:MFS family permease
MTAAAASPDGHGDGDRTTTGTTPIPARRWTYVIPVAVVMYMLAFLDRSNVSVVLPYMDGDLSLSAADEGLVTGVFFLGYVFLQIPGAILAQRWSARKTARWISRSEARYVEEALAADEAGKPTTGSGSYPDAVRQRSVLVLIGIYFFWITGFYGFTLWLPSVVKTLTHDGSSTQVGLLSAIPFTVALVVMVANAAWSDRTGKRRQAVAVPLVVAMAALLLGQVVQGGVLGMVLLCVTAGALYAPYGPFWAIPGGVLRIEVVAVAMGLINALGNLGGYVGPYLVGWLTDSSGTSVAGFGVLAGFLAVAVVLVLAVLRPAGGPEAANSSLSVNPPSAASRSESSESSRPSQPLRPSQQGPEPSPSPSRTFPTGYSPSAAAKRGAEGGS